MAHFARINSENKVIYITPIPDEMITDQNGVEQEYLAFSHLYRTIPDSASDRWMQVSWSGRVKNRKAGLGFNYDPQLDAFIPPKPYDSWVLDENDYEWKAPVSRPNPSENYKWDEELVNWVEI